MVEKQNLSALFDGDNIEQSLITQVVNDNQAQQVWKGYALTRDIMRGDAPESINWDISRHVAAALENEAEHHGVTYAPVIEQSQPQTLAQPAAARVTPIEAQPSPLQAKSSLPRWLQQVAQVGMAAGVALVAIIGVQQYNSQPMQADVIGQPPVLQTIPLAGSAQPVSLTRENLQPNPSEAQILEHRKRINAMFQDYELQLRLNADAIGVAEQPQSSITSAQD